MSTPRFAGRLAVLVTAALVVSACAATTPGHPTGVASSVAGASSDPAAPTGTSPAVTVPSMPTTPSPTSPSSTGSVPTASARAAAPTPADPHPSRRVTVTAPPLGTGASGPASPTVPSGGAAPAAHVRTRGTVFQTPIPGTVSGFHARPAWVYLPPAYTAADHPSFPLLVLIAGEPGGPQNWVDMGHLARTMDDYAAEHQGVAPIVIVPDPTGSHTGNTMCANSRLGNAATYITRDVTGWAENRLRVERDTAHWAIGGFSLGGTCALQFAVSYPRLFPTFLDISGESVPTLGNPTESVDRAFGGDEAAYRAIQPLWIMSQDAKDPAKAALLRTLDGTFSVGTEDPEYAAMQRTVVAACREAGITVHAGFYPGKHLWVDAYVALVTALPHLATRMGLS